MADPVDIDKVSSAPAASSVFLPFLLPSKCQCGLLPKPGPLLCGVDVPAYTHCLHRNSLKALVFHGSSLPTSDFLLTPKAQGCNAAPFLFFFDAAAPFPFPLDWSADPQPNRTYGAGGDRGHPPDRTRTLRLMTGQGGWL